MGRGEKEEGETIVGKVNSLITGEIGIDDYQGGQRDREVAPFVRPSPPFNTFIQYHDPFSH